jgi:putative nucleotidyltransferase with HDIG domain
MTPPGLAALEANRSTIFRTSLLLRSGTDGKIESNPFGGGKKTLTEISLKRLRIAATRPNARVEAYAVFLAGSSLAVLVGLVGAGYTLGNPLAVVALCIAAALAQRGQVELTRALKVSISLFPILLAAVLFGPVGAMAVSVSSMLGEERRPLTRWILYASSRSLTGALAGVIASSFADQTLPSILAATAAAAVCTQILDLAFAAFVFTLRGHGSPVAALREIGPLSFTALPLYVPAVALLALGYQAQPLVLPLFLAPALVAQRSFVLYQGERKLAGDLAEVNRHLERANLSFATALVATLDARDRYTAGHSAAVAIYARDIATRMGLSDADIRLAHLCGLVHDIGKIGLPAGLLEKPGALTLEERRHMEEHSVIGERILAKVDDYAEIAKIVRHHHERVDGQGYPDGLFGDDIPLLSRIIAVADAYNAMTSDRPYRDAMPSQVARMRLAHAVESQFDTTVTAAFEAILATADEAYRSGTRFDFDFDTRESDSAVTPASLRAVEVA